MIVAMRRLDGRQTSSAVGRAEKADIKSNGVGVFRVGENMGVIPGAHWRISLLELTRTQVSPPLSERNAPLSAASNNAYTRCELAGETATPTRPSVPFGMPGFWIIFSHVAPPSWISTNRFRAAAFEAIRGPVHFPERGINSVGIIRIDRKIDRAGLGTARQHLLPGGAAVVDLKTPRCSFGPN